MATFVYAFNDEAGRGSLWEDLKLLAATIKDPWIILADFNDILHQDERVGRAVKMSKSTTFKECVEACKVEYIKYSGSFFTWTNKQKIESQIHSKIDRVLENQEWLSKFENAEIVFMMEGLFDHCPALLTVYPEVKIGRQPFRFFQMW
uniref:Endonuclease/exonuclease/phosphatase domain-containing protein n=1 Tax=Cannabis sativa TaxID=3483 RepID=A0A803NKL4_CANSA